MRMSLPLAAVGVLLTVAPVMAQDGRITSPAQIGINATTPSRIEGSRREMNRGLGASWHVNMTPTMARSYGERALARAGFVCAVGEAVVVGQSRDGAPLVKIDCIDGGGLVIADSNPIIATDCLDLTPSTAVTGRNSLRIEECRLPANVASVAAEREAERRQSSARN